MGIFPGTVHKGLHSRIAVKIEVHVLLCSPPWNSQLLGQAKGRHTIDQPKVDCLGRAPLIIGHLIRRGNAKHLSRRGAMDIQPFRKRL